MDVALSLFEHAQVQLWYYGKFLLAFAVVVAVLRSAWFKGHLGEFMVNLAVRLRLDKNTYHLCKDVTLPTADGTTQIDHILVSRFGVFVIETKYLRGWIFGKERQPQWTQVIYRHKSAFQNPLLQNYKHVKTVQDLLALTPEQVHSVVVFMGDSKFKTPMPENVTFGGAFITYIRSKTTPVLSSEQLKDVLTRLKIGALERSRHTNKAHRAHVQSLVKAKTSAPAASALQCPKCGADMVRRTAKRGNTAGQQFWGCTAYPKCRGIVKG